MMESYLDWLFGFGDSGWRLGRAACNRRLLRMLLVSVIGSRVRAILSKETHDVACSVLGHDIQRSIVIMVDHLFSN